MVEFKYYNANPMDNETNDCVIRAIMTYNYGEVNNLELNKIYYNNIYMTLSRYGMKKFLMINDEKNYMEFLKDMGLKEYKCYKNVNVDDLDRFFGQGDMIINLKGHLTCMRDWCIYDTFDCRNELVESVFVLEKKESKVRKTFR